ncbi:hypothetical protein MRX96_017834 [Rhipicephalus microplus]
MWCTITAVPGVALVLVVGSLLVNASSLQAGSFWVTQPWLADEREDENRKAMVAEREIVRIAARPMTVNVSFTILYAVTPAIHQHQSHDREDQGSHREKGESPASQHHRRNTFGTTGGYSRAKTAFCGAYRTACVRTTTVMMWPCFLTKLCASSGAYPQKKAAIIEDVDDQKRRAVTRSSCAFNTSQKYR